MLVDSSGRVYDAKVLFALPEHDLLMMDVPGLPAPPIDLNSYVQAKEGDVIAAVSPTGHVLSLIHISEKPGFEIQGGADLSGSGG